jgi:hypothetical protein
MFKSKKIISILLFLFFSATAAFSAEKDKKPDNNEISIQENGALKEKGVSLIGIGATGGVSLWVIFAKILFFGSIALTHYLFKKNNLSWLRKIRNTLIGAGIGLLAILFFIPNSISIQHEPAKKLSGLHKEVLLMQENVKDLDSSVQLLNNNSDIKKLPEKLDQVVYVLEQKKVQQVPDIELIDEKAINEKNLENQEASVQSRVKYYGRLKFSKSTFKTDSPESIHFEVFKNGEEPDPFVFATFIASILTFIGLLFSAYSKFAGDIGKLRSQWIDNLRQEISEFYSQITTISLLWRSEPNQQNKSPLSDIDLQKFRDRNRDSYMQIYKCYGSILQRLKYNQGILMRFMDKGGRRAELELRLKSILEKFIGNAYCSGFEDNDEELLHIVKLGEEIIKREREYIEMWIPIRQAIVFILILLIGVAMILLLYIKYPEFAAYLNKL